MTDFLEALPGFLILGLCIAFPPLLIILLIILAGEEA